MNKKNLSFIPLLTLSLALLGGCGDGDKNVSDIVLEVGNKQYTAEQLYNQLLSTGTGANEAFSIVLRLVVESSMETGKNIQAAADMAEETFEEEVETYAKSNGVAVKDARKKLLEEKGYKTVEEMKAQIIYEQKLTRINEQYWETHKSEFYNDYIANRLPYLVRHVLVKLDDNTNGNKIANNVNVSQAEAEKIYDVITRFKNGDRFSYVAEHETDDSGSASSGGAYYMDTTTSFVDEFLYGTYIFDAYTEKKEENGVTYYKWGKNEAKYETLTNVGFINEETEDKVATYYENGLNVVTMDLVEKLGEVAGKTSTGDFHYIGYVQDEDYISSSGITEYDSSLNNLNSNYNAYARSIIFNRAFNKPGISVIGGFESKDKAEAAGVKNSVEIRNGNKSMWVLADEKGHPIFFVAAKGSSNDIWLHFLTIDVSSLQDIENAKKYFTINPSATDDYVSYAEDPAFNVDHSSATENKLVSEIESYIKSYVTAGSGSTVGEESLLNFKMLEDYMKDNEITWENTGLKTAIEAYIASKREYLNKKHSIQLAQSFDKHADKLEVAESKLVQMGIKPYECAVVLPSQAYEPIKNSTSTGNLCRYVYGKGYQVKLSYYYHTDLLANGTSYTKINTSTDVVSFKKDDRYASGFNQWVYIGGENETLLPTENEMNLKTGYKFLGWYTTKDFSGSPVTKVDLRNSSIHNQTIFYANIVTVAETGTYNVKYTYKYEGTDITVEDTTLIQSSKNSLAYDVNGEEGSNTYTITKSDFTSTEYEVVGFEGGDSFTVTLNGQNISQGVSVTVYVKPNPTTLVYKFVDANGTDVLVDSKDLSEVPETYTFNPEEEVENNLVIDTSLITMEDYEIVGVKYSATEEWSQAEDEFEIELTNCGKSVYVYIIVSPTGTGE